MTRKLMLMIATVVAMLGIGVAAALAATEDTSATLSSDVAVPTEVSVGSNAFQIKVWATGNLPADRPGDASVVKKYSMATNGTITASSSAADVESFQFQNNFNYSAPACNSTTPDSSQPQGCRANPFVVNATLDVAASTPSGTTGTLTVKNTGSQSLDADPTPAQGYVRVQALDTTPPSISYVLNPSSPDGDNGWYKGNVTLTWTVTDNESAVEKTGCVDQNITADQQETTYSCSATSDGGSADPVNVKIKRDATPPAVSVTGFTDDQVFVKGVDALPTAGCSRSDATSGIDPAGSTGPTASGGLNANGVGTVTYTCGATDNAGNTNSDSKSYSVIHNYSGFFRPVDNPDVLNVVKAGSAIPVKFSLSGYQGLDIIATGYPKSNKIDCTSSADLDNIEETVTAGGSTLHYDATADQYVYVWKTEKSWAGTCRQLQVKLDDGTTHVANFKLTK